MIDATNYRETKGQAEERQRRLSANGFMHAQGSRYAGCRLSTFEITCPGQRRVVDALKSYLDDFPSQVAAGAGIVLFGPSGTGKDHLLVGLAGEAIYTHDKINAWDVQKDDPPKHPYEIVRVRGADLFEQMRSTMDADATEADIIDPLTYADVLILSDPVPIRGAVTSFQTDVLYRIIDRRYAWQKPTWATLNVASGAEADERLGVALADRLRDGTLCLYCDWPSYRKPKPRSTDNEAAQ